MSLQLSAEQEKKLRKLLVRGFTKKQLQILDSVSDDKFKSITSASRKISEERKLPLSTVKLDLKIFEQLGLLRIIDKDGFKKPIMTRFGKIIIRILLGYNNFQKLLETLLSYKLSIYLLTVK